MIRSPSHTKMTSSVLQMLFLALSISLSVTTTNANYVIKLNDSNFEDITQAATGQTTGKWFINFHSPSCGYCKQLAPTWSAFSEEIRDTSNNIGGLEGGEVLIGSVDVKDNPKLKERFEIMKLPTIMLFAEEGMYKYPPGKERNIDSFIDFSLGGYKKTEKLSVPKGPSGLLKLVGDLRKQVYDIEILRFLLDDFEHILYYRKNAAFMLLGIGIMIGFFLAALLGLNRSAQTSRNKVKAKRKSKNE